MARRSDSVFLRALEPPSGWDGGRAAVSASQRARLLDAITRAVAEKGYAAVTIGDVVQGAGVSRRTFYEHFEDKEQCFLAAYATGGEAVLEAIVAAIATQPDDWQARLRVGLETYTCVLAAEPELARTLVVDVLGAGPRAIELRQSVYGRFVELLRDVADLAAEQLGGGPRMPDLFLRALVGGIAELVQHHIVVRGAASLGELTGDLVGLATAVFEGAHRTAPAPPGRR